MFLYFVVVMSFVGFGLVLVSWVGFEVLVRDFYFGVNVIVLLIVFVYVFNGIFYCVGFVIYIYGKVCYIFYLMVFVVVSYFLFCIFIVLCFGSVGVVFVMIIFYFFIVMGMIVCVECLYGVGY